MLFNNNTELSSIKGLRTWEVAGENIPDGMYKMMEFDEDDMEDGRPAAIKAPNNTTKTNPPSPKQRYLSYFQRNEAKFCDGYDSDGEIGPFVPERFFVETVDEEEDNVLTPKGPPMVVTWMLSDTATDTTKTMAQDDDHPEGVFGIIKVTDVIGMKNNTLKVDFYLQKEKYFL